MIQLQATIEKAFLERHQLTPNNCDATTREAVEEVITQLDTGQLRVAEKINGEWITHAWIKQAVLLAFRIHKEKVMASNMTSYFDKVPLKYQAFSEADFQHQNARIVPPATVRLGAYIGESVVLMPSYINIGAYIGHGAMIDTWATIGSCAQIGKNVHISGGVGIGGVLEPIQANPTIIEDNCFIGARSEIVEGVIIEEGAVISMGVFLSKSTKIYNRLTGEISYGRIPKRAVVVPGTLPSADNSHSLYCAVIVKQVDEQTREKTNVNELLR
ncbi:MAG: 2,3,4,5-tetrahydropyridine-2,6-dicarboxylate N-succinyltransferase [Pseudomonadota bacterium]